MSGLPRLFAVVSFIAFVGAVDYCKINTCNKGPHTMCKFSTMKPGPKCNGMAPTKLTGLEKMEIVKAHNKFRAQVASGQEFRGNPGPQPAGRIPPLKWDDELATIAQRWANQCQYRTHDLCRNTDRSSVGQNIAIQGFSSDWETSMTELVQMWYDEVRYFNANSVNSFVFNEKTGHYTQLVWSKTTHVGCGIARFQENGFFQTFLVCNYSPSGNLSYNNVGLPIY